MQRRTFLVATGSLAAGGLRAVATPPDSAPEGAPEPHFPNRLHQFVWRNWELANTGRLAQVARWRPEAILEIGRSMGLPRKPQLSADQLRRIYITVIRQNWRLLPNDQLIELLGWTREKFEFTLKEDDFLDAKLGAKPDCQRVIYKQPDAEARRRAAEIGRTLHTYLQDELDREGEPPFQFVQRLSDLHFPPARDGAARASAEQVDLTGWSPRGEDSADRRLVDRFTVYL